MMEEVIVYERENILIYQYSLKKTPSKSQARKREEYKKKMH